MKAGTIVKFKAYADEKLPENPLAEGTMLTVIGKAKDKGSFHMRPYGNGEDASEDVVLYDDEVIEDGFDKVDADKWLAAQAVGDGSGKAKGKKEKVVAAKKGGKAEPKSKLNKAAPAAKKAAAKQGKLAKGAGGKGAKKAAKKAAAEKPVVEEVEIEYGKEVERVLRGKNALEAVLELEKGQRMSNWVLGGVLSKIKREKLFVAIGAGYDDSQNGFEAFVKENMDTEYRTAMNHIKKYEHFRSLGVTEEQIANIKWSKLDMLIGVTTTAEEAEEWLEEAEETTKEDLFAKVTKHRIKMGNAPAQRGKHATGPKLSRMVFQIFEDQAEVISKALTAAKKEMKSEGETSDSQALFYIVSEWLKDN